MFSPVIEPIYSFASMLFPRDETSPRHWAVTRCDAAVAALLRACSVHTVYPEPGDVPLVNIPEADDVLYCLPPCVPSVASTAMVGWC